MKHLKSYKNKIEDTSQPQVGYYVILNNLLNHRYNYDITQYITTHIGQVIVKSENNNYLIKRFIIQMHFRHIIKMIL